MACRWWCWVNGVWRLTTELLVTSRLAEVVTARIAGARTSREALDLLALVAPVSVIELTEMAGPAALEHAEGAGLVGVQANGRRTEVVLAHPVFGRVLRDTMATLTRRRLLREHVEWVERRGGRRREDPLRLATWRLDARYPVEQEMLLHAARLARSGQDFSLVERLTRAAGQPTPEAQLLLGEACHELGHYAEAERVLALAQEAATEPSQLAQIAAMRADTLTLGLLQPAAGLAAIRAARARFTSPVAQAELQAVEGTVKVYDGQPDAALDLLAMLFAAETALAAAAAYRRAGSTRLAAALQMRSSTLARQCEGARTPALIAATATASLTARELEVALLAARGLTSQEIASQLVLSVRTVHHHLQHAYEKLGITRRKQLAGALASIVTELAGPRPSADG